MIIINNNKDIFFISFMNGYTHLCNLKITPFFYLNLNLQNIFIFFVNFKIKTILEVKHKYSPTHSKKFIQLQCSFTSIVLCLLKPKTK